MIARRTVVLLIACLAITAAAQEKETVTPQPLDEELVPRGAAITRGAGDVVAPTEDAEAAAAGTGDEEDEEEETTQPLPAKQKAAGRAAGTASGSKADTPARDSPAKGKAATAAAAAAAVAGTATSAATKAPEKAASGAPPASKFQEFNEQWLEQTEDMAADFVNTPSMEHLKAGTFGKLPAADLGFDPTAAITTAVHATLARCLHTLNVIRTIGMFHEGVIPRKEPVSGCEHRKFKLLFVLEKPGEWKPGRGVLSELSAVNARLFGFARQMAKRGHRVQVADPERFSQVDMDALDAVVFVKALDRGYRMLANSSVPLLWDHLDEWDGFPFWDLSSWDLKYAFAGVFTAGRVAKMAFDRAGIPAHFVYHNHNNYAGIHRPDRSPLVRVLALQGDYFRDERSEIFPFLEDYSRQKGLQFRHGLYTGSGWDVDDYARVMHQGGEDFGEQLSSYMGFSGVDVAVIWPKAYVQFHICYRPTAELAHFASLGIPTVVYPFASYLDVLVDFGYPLVAENLADAGLLLDRLVASPDLRQEASMKLLEIAKYLSVEVLAEDYEQGLCAFLSPEALALRKRDPDE